MRATWRNILPVGILGAVLIGIQVVVSAAGQEVYLDPLVRAAYAAIVVMGLCLVMGHAGQISLGHGAFVAVGGYTSAVLTTRDIPAAHDSAWGAALQTWRILEQRQDLYGNALVSVVPWVAFAAAIVLTAAIAILVGWPSLRLKGHYLAMATLGFGLIIYRLVLGTTWLGAADGISGVPPWTLAGSLVVSGARAHRVMNYYIAWGLALLVLAGLLNVTRSRVGRALQAIHGGELAANAMGINTAASKLQVFVLSAVLAAASGAFLTHYNGYIGPSRAGAMESVRYVALVAAGGMHSLLGVVTVSSVLNYLSLRGYFGSYDHAVFGALLIVIVSWAPQGPLQPIAAGFRGLARRIANVKNRLTQRGDHGAA